jgi:uroporphyrin-III C-methyltransferase
MAVTGGVSLVGAGPGDPDLLTRRAVARLRAADLVLYDALVDERVLGLARRAQRFFVGKRAGRHALSQPEIHAVMIRAAQRGRRVVRLKGGDPFVFGRGGEEVLALREAGVPFDIVPGVSSLMAGPALAGIPVTHRGVATAVLFVTGHDPEAFAATVRGLGGSPTTLVVAMGYATRAALAGVLIGAGWGAATPSAVVAGASLPGQQVWRGPLADLAAGKAIVEGDQPALLVVGDVARLELTGAAMTTDASGAEAPPARRRSSGAPTDPHGTR